MRPQKSIGLRILLGVAAIACGLGVQVVGTLIDKGLFIEISAEYSFGVIALLSIILGFAVMGVLIYVWAIKGTEEGQEKNEYLQGRSRWERFKDWLKGNPPEEDH